jgi:hypothetical protein
MNIAERCDRRRRGDRVDLRGFVAVENSASVLMLEIAPQEAACGNSVFTGGAFRIG